MSEPSISINKSVYNMDLFEAALTRQTQRDSRSLQERIETILRLACGDIDLAMITASSSDDLELMKYFLECGAKVNTFYPCDPECPDPHAGTALHHAVSHHNHDAIKLLIDCGARVDIRNSLLLTPYDVALECKLEHEDTLEMLRVQAANDPIFDA